MSANRHFRDLPSEAVTEQRKSVLASPEFHRSMRMARFLQVVVERTLSGNAHELREYAIGTEVFAKPLTFDPRPDSIARVKARRLRRKINDIAAPKGAADPIAIELKAGSYVPSFRRRLAAAETRPKVMVSKMPAEAYAPPICSVEANVNNEREHGGLRVAEASSLAIQRDFDHIVSEMHFWIRLTADLIGALVTSACAVRIVYGEYTRALREDAGAATATDEQFPIAPTERSKPLVTGAELDKPGTVSLTGVEHIGD